MSIFQILNKSLESNQNTEKTETEVIIYSLISNMAGLENASSIEQQYQLDGTFNNGYRCRVRRTTKDGKERYEFTYKIPTSEEEGIEANKEFTVEVDKDFFEGFRSVANSAVDKTRYIFNSDKVDLNLLVDNEKQIISVPNVQYEVDVYKDKDGQVVEWCKIDLEVDNIINFLAKQYPDLDKIKLNIKISHLPFKPEQSILTLSADTEQQQFIDQLWESRFKLTP